ncbi:hypothetical protein BH23CHL7_BH23CHL7_09900 [soil metagenome]
MRGSTVLTAGGRARPLSAPQDPLRPTSAILGGGHSARRAALTIGAALVVLIALALADRLTPPPEAPVALQPGASPTPAPTPAPTVDDTPIELEIGFGLGGVRRVPELLSPASRGSRLLGAHQFLVFFHRPAADLRGSIRLSSPGESGPLSLELLGAAPSGNDSSTSLHSVGAWELDFVRPLRPGEAARKILQVSGIGATSRLGAEPFTSHRFDVTVVLSGSESVPIIVIRLLGTNDWPSGRHP